MIYGHSYKIVNIACLMHFGTHLIKVLDSYRMNYLVQLLSFIIIIFFNNLFHIFTHLHFEIHPGSGCFDNKS